MLKKVLIANRGEVALRVLRACQEMGIATVAVYSEPDRKSLHVRHADEAIALGGQTAAESYLRMDAILAAASTTGADAIHPGYGFLSENAEFSEACTDAGLAFVGPPASAIRPMGDKIEARARMIAAGVPVAPGSDGPLDDVEALKTLANDVGYPVMIKAAAGGGGKGIRKVDSPTELEAAFRQAASEAETSFGNAACYLEKFVSPARHIEIQILTDSHGNGIHLGERECSLQRRSQKLVEECPSAFVTEALRKRMAEVAVKGALAIGYVGAGTMEFLVDAEGGFYFMEMNTRLQVEHTVTEMVTGIDLVKEQLHVAAGNPLAFAQEAVTMRGHAIELRVCCEDPFRNFAPSVGKIEGLQLPGGPHVRLDSCLYDGMEVTLFYDPMVAKLCVWANTRSRAIARMRHAASEFHVGGVKTSVPLFLHLADNNDYQNNNVHTTWLEGFVSDLVPETDERERDAAVAAAVLEHVRRQAPSTVLPSGSRESVPAWRRLARDENVGGTWL